MKSTPHALVVLGVLAAVQVAASEIKTILHFSDVHLNVSATDKESNLMPIRYGDDATISLLESSLKYAKKVIPNPDFFLYTGDHVVHGDLSDKYVASTVQKNVETLAKYYPPTKEQLDITAIIGNTDGNPDYHMEVTDPATSVNPSIEFISQVWNETLSKTNFDAFNRKGYLSYQLEEKLHVLSLNTVPYSPSHVPDTSSIPDPFGQFAWLEESLQKFRSSSSFVYIVGHIAPIVDSYGGNPQWHVDYIKKYKSIVKAYPDVVKAQLFGHVHSVEFRLPLKEKDTFSQVPLFVSGSISPLFGNNPSFMVWNYNSTSYELLDFTVYGTNISSDQQLDWKPLYQATTAYDLPSLSSDSLGKLVNRMKMNSSLLEDYYWNMKAQSHRLAPCTTDQCRAKILCALQWYTTKHEYDTCVTANTEQSQIFAAVEQIEKEFSSHAAYQVIGMTLCAVAGAILTVVAIAQTLRKGGIIKSSTQREEETEDLFPML